MKKHLLLILAIGFCFLANLDAQVNTTANDGIAPYTGLFRPGINLGYYPPFNDVDLANLAAGNPQVGVVGIGAKTTRPALKDEFLEQWGYNVRVNEMQHFSDVGLKDLTCIVGYPSPAHKKTEILPCSVQSQMFENLYTPIWDGGANGTPYNDDNYYAAYLYKLISLYGDNVKYWEVWNEPAHTQQWQKGFYPASDNYPGSWWHNDPEPCDLDRFYGSIQEYVRMMRITYEVVKTIDPTDYVLVGGVAFPSFLDAILRNTDNPNGGAVSADYPLGGGAYFDVLGIHVYPDIDGTVKLGWNNQTQMLDFARHSDRAAASLENRKASYESVLTNYGYGGQYPEKEWIVTELNSPRRKFNSESMASQESQINFVIKVMTKAEKNNFHQVETYALVDKTKEGSAVDEFDLLGMYKNFENSTPGSVANYADVEMNPEGRAYKTYSDLTFGKNYSASRVAAMNLPNNIDGAAFLDADGKYQYVLWAKTTQDKSESASASYSFPSSFNLSQVKKQDWESSFTGNSSLISGSNIQLTGRPIYLNEDLLVTSNLSGFFSANQTESCGTFTTQFSDFSLGNPTSWSWTFEGGNPATSTQQNPSVTYSTSGSFDVTLTIGDGIETETITKEGYINLDATVIPEYSYSANGLQVIFTNESANADNYRWYFGDGTESTSIDPVHTFNSPGTYEIRLAGFNDCGQASEIKTIVVTTGSESPQSSFSADFRTGCAPFTVNYADQSTNSPTNWSWQFEGGTPEFTNEQNPEVIYETPGVYTVILSVSNAAGTSFVSQPGFITVLASPEVSFTNFVSGNNVTFFGNASEGDISWDFGDGTSSTLESPSHLYDDEGTYEVTLTATNDCGSSSESKTIVISTITGAAPVSDFNASETSGCSPMTVNFTDESENESTSWNWTFVGGNPSSSNLQNPTVVFTATGEHAVILVASNSMGSDTKVGTILVNSTPTVNFAYSTNEKEVSFNSNITNGTIVDWNFGDNTTSTEANPVHTYSTVGTYNVVLTVENECGQVTESNSVQVSVSNTGNAPIADFETSPTSGCSPVVVEYHDLSTNNPTSWNWSFPGGTPNSSTIQNPVVVYSTAGSYSATLISSNNSGFNTFTKTDLVEVGSLPIPDYDIIILSSQVRLLNSSDGATSYHWDFGDGNESTEENPIYNYAESGTYVITLTTTNDCGETSEQQSVIINVDVTPVSDFGIDVEEGCAPLTVNFTDFTTMNPENWVWSFNGANPTTSTDQNPSVTYDEPGTYNISLTTTNSAGSDTKTKMSVVKVYADPSASFYSIKNGPNVQLINTSQGGGTYLWDFGDETTSTEFSPTHDFKYTGVYNVTLTIANICGSDTYETTINVITGVEDFDALNLFEVSPNPTADILNLKIQGLAERTIEISVFNILGTEVISQALDFNSGNLNHQIDMSGLSTGTYVLKVQTENQIGIEKIILQK